MFLACPSADLSGREGSRRGRPGRRGPGGGRGRGGGHSLQLRRPYPFSGRAAPGLVLLLVLLREAEGPRGGSDQEVLSCSVEHPSLPPSISSSLPPSLPPSISFLPEINSLPLPFSLPPSLFPSLPPAGTGGSTVALSKPALIKWEGGEVEAPSRPSLSLSIVVYPRSVRPFLRPSLPPSLPPTTPIPGPYFCGVLSFPFLPPSLPPSLIPRTQPVHLSAVVPINDLILVINNILIIIITPILIIIIMILIIIRCASKPDNARPFKINASSSLSMVRPPSLPHYPILLFRSPSPPFLPPSLPFFHFSLASNLSFPHGPRRQRTYSKPSLPPSLLPSLPPSLPPSLLPSLPPFFQPGQQTLVSPWATTLRLWVQSATRRWRPR